MFWAFSFPSFQFCAVAKIENSDLKKCRDFQDFRGFWVFELVNRTVSIYFQNHPETNYLYGEFCPTSAGISPVASWILHCWEGMKSVPASYKHNIAFIKKWLYAYHHVYRPVLFFIPSSFTSRKSTFGSISS